DKVPSCFLNTAAKRGTLAGIFGLKEYSKLRILSLQFFQQFAGAIGRSIVDAQHFDFKWNLENTVQQLSQCAAFVVVRNDYGKVHLLFTSLKQERFQAFDKLFVGITIVKITRGKFLSSPSP